MTWDTLKHNLTLSISTIQWRWQSNYYNHNFSGSRSSKTFKPKKNIPEGSHQHDLMKHAAATLGSGKTLVITYDAYLHPYSRLSNKQHCWTFSSPVSFMCYYILIIRKISLWVYGFFFIPSVRLIDSVVYFIVSRAMKFIFFLGLVWSMDGSKSIHHS